MRTITERWIFRMLATTEEHIFRFFRFVEQRFHSSIFFGMRSITKWLGGTRTTATPSFLLTQFQGNRERTFLRDFWETHNDTSEPIEQHQSSFVTSF